MRTARASEDSPVAVRAMARSVARVSHPLRRCFAAVTPGGSHACSRMTRDRVPGAAAGRRRRRHAARRRQDRRRRRRDDARARRAVRRPAARTGRPGAHIDLRAAQRADPAVLAVRRPLGPVHLPRRRPAASRPAAAAPPSCTTSWRSGDVVGVGGPRNNFPLVPAEHYLFVAGGIGITPMLPMIAQADLLGADWRLLYGGRRRALDGLPRRARGVRRPRPGACRRTSSGCSTCPAFLGEPRPGVRIYSLRPGAAARGAWRPPARAGRRTPCAPSGSSPTRPAPRCAPRRSRSSSPAPARPSPSPPT